MRAQWEKTRRNGITALAVLVALAAVSVLGVSWARGGAPMAANVAGILGFPLAIAVALAGLWQWRRAAAAAYVTSAEPDAALRSLVDLVRRQWQREANARALDDPHPIPVRWSLSAGALMDHAEHISTGPLSWYGRSDQIPGMVDQFLRLRRRRLVIIGAPGTGKTTLAVQILLELIERRTDTDPVPVLFSLATWDPTVRPRFSDWISDQLHDTYSGLTAAKHHPLAEDGKLLPILDGLDEIPPERRVRIIRSLNASLGHSGVIITSRSAEYDDTVGTGELLTAAAVIQPAALSAAEAAHYVRSHLPREPTAPWREFLDALTGDTTPVSAVAATPLGLWLIRSVFIDTHADPTVLLDANRFPTESAVKRHLLDGLIPAAISARPPTDDRRDTFHPARQHDPERMRRYLTTIAEMLSNSRTRDWRWWEIRYNYAFPLIARLRFTAAGLILGLLTAISLMGLVFFLHLAPADTPSAVRLTVVALGGLAGGWYWFRWWPRRRRIMNRPEIFQFSVKKASKKSRNIALVMSAVALVVEVILAFSEGMTVAIASGILFIAVIAMVLFADDRAIIALYTPQESERRARATVAQGAAAGAAAVAFAIFASLGVYVNGPAMIGVAIVAVASAGFFALFTGWSYLAYFVGLLRYATLRRLPLRLLGTLDDAHRLGLLRIVGPAFQFRHAELQDHLAPPAQPPKHAPAPAD